MCVKSIQHSSNPSKRTQISFALCTSSTLISCLYDLQLIVQCANATESPAKKHKKHKKRKRKKKVHIDYQSDFDSEEDEVVEAKPIKLKIKLGSFSK